MGLDLVEFAIAVEDAFELPIPDADWESLRTPRAVIDYLESRLAVTASAPPVVQTSFYRLRRAVASELRRPRRDIGPSTALAELVVDRPISDVTRAVAARLGLEPRDLSHSPVRGALSHLRLAPPRTLGAVAEELAMLRPAKMRPKHSGWTRAQITEIVLKLLEHETGIDRARVSLDSDFIRDLGMG